MLFSDNFDYQNLHRDFISGVLSEEELGNKIYLHLANNEYAVGVNNLRTYDAVSRDVAHRWLYPFVADTKVFARENENSWYKFSTGNVYIDRAVLKPTSSKIGVATFVGQGTTIGEMLHLFAVKAGGVYGSCHIS